MNTIKSTKGITLIALVVTIIVLLILAGVTIKLTMNENGILSNAKRLSEETNKQTASEKINLKITNLQMQTYSQKQKMPSLQELADEFCEDNEIEYVEVSSKKTGSLNKITVGDNETIYTKLKDYPYEFEINSSLQLASIDGVKVAESNTVTLTNEQYNNILKRLDAVENSSHELDYENAVDISSYTSESNKYTFPKGGYMIAKYHATASGTHSVFVNISDYPYVTLLRDNQWGIMENFSSIVNKDQTVYFTFAISTNNYLEAFFIPFK